MPRRNPNQLRLLDTTLREGEQFADARFSSADRIRLALALDALGVDELEVPSPAVSPNAAAQLRDIIQLELSADVRAHVRCRPADIQLALRAGAQGLNLFLGTSPALVRYSLRRTWSEQAAQIRESVALAVSSGAFVRFSAEDAFRTSRARLFAAFDVALESGARRLGIPDTVGTATPDAVGSTVRALCRRYPGVSLEFHGHNDTGCSVANSLAAWQAGADCLDVTVLGIGERVGITSLGGLLARLYTVAPDAVSRYRFDLLPALDAQVAALTGMTVPFNQPLTSAHAFTHVAGIHTNAVLRSPGTYEVIDPATVGRSRVIAVGSRLTGRHAVANYLESLLGRPPDGREVVAATSALKDCAEDRRLDRDVSAAVVTAALQALGRS
ncbi:MAG TPA: LeuA family protein [Candidatus Dormibacteraeota bacterium]|nr:LeuA family protein [Candidatus Dormibacteraeota bacterium]